MPDIFLPTCKFPERTRRNPQTGQSIRIPARRVAKFSAARLSKTLFEVVSKIEAVARLSSTDSLPIWMCGWNDESFNPLPLPEQGETCVYLPLRNPDHECIFPNVGLVESYFRLKTVS